MRLFLVRHGETVDNVAGVYAGSRDSALTIHGIQQARLLGQHLAKSRPKLTHIFASSLQRAYKTADAVRAAQIGTGDGVEKDDEREDVGLIVSSIQQLVEQDFGFYEGRPFYARSRDSSKSGREAHYETHRHEPGFVDVESKDSMAARCDVFLQEHLIPLLDFDGVPNELTVVVVSHGILLSNLWRRLLRRLPKKSLKIEPEIIAYKGQLDLEHLGGWSNTGFLELSIRHDFLQYDALPEETCPVKDHKSAVDDLRSPLRKASTTSANPGKEPSTHGKSNDGSPNVVPDVLDQAQAPPLDVDKDTPIASLLEPSESQPVADRANTTLLGWSTFIMTVNGQEHLRGLKRTKGGIGRARYDEGQQTMDNFFKRAKTS